MDQEETKKNKKAWYKSWWGIIILILFWPFSLSYFIWKKNSFSKKVKVGLLVILWIFVIILMASNSSDETKVNPQTETQAETPAVSIQPIPSVETQVEAKPSIPALNLKHDPSFYIEYAEKMKKIFEEQAKYSTSAGQIMSKWPNLTSGDIIDLAAATVILEGEYDKVVAITPPEELASSHKKYVASYKLLKEAMPLYRKGLDSLDSVIINQATVKINQATILNKQATEELDDFTKSVAKQLGN